jgi:hypothetical protein
VNQELKLGVIRHYQNVISACGILTGDRDRLRQTGRADDVDGEGISTHLSNGRRKQRSWIIHMDIQRLSMLERNDNSLADLPRSQRHIN